MPIEYDIDSDAGILVQRLLGQLTAADFAEFFAATEADPRFHERLGRLVILSGATGYPPPSDVVGVVEQMRRRIATHRPRFAIVADAPLDIGIAYMFMGQAGLSDRMELFATSAEAEEWLLNAG